MRVSCRCAAAVCRVGRATSQHEHASVYVSGIKRPVCAPTRRSAPLRSIPKPANRLRAARNGQSDVESRHVTWSHPRRSSVGRRFPGTKLRQRANSSGAAHLLMGQAYFGGGAEAWCGMDAWSISPNAFPTSVVRTGLSAENVAMAIPETMGTALASEVPLKRSFHFI